MLLTFYMAPIGQCLIVSTAKTISFVDVWWTSSERSLLVDVILTYTYLH
jgi:hypothetical protein